jgi:hypothetical protein
VRKPVAGCISIPDCTGDRATTTIIQKDEMTKYWVDSHSDQLFEFDPEASKFKDRDVFRWPRWSWPLMGKINIVSTAHARAVDCPP